MHRHLDEDTIIPVPMLLAVDIGNTHTAFGLFDGEALRLDWRMETRVERTADEYAATLSGLLRYKV